MSSAWNALYFFSVWKTCTHPLNIQVPPPLSGLPRSPTGYLLLPPPGGPLVHLSYCHYLFYICLCINWALKDWNQNSFIFIVSTSPSSVPCTGQVLEESLLIKCIEERFSKYVSKGARIPQGYLRGHHEADGKAEWVEFQKSEQSIMEKE